MQQNDLANNVFLSGACHNTWCTKHACSYLAVISTFPFDPLVTVASPLHSLEYYCRDLVEFTVIYNICYIERCQTHVIPLNPTTSSEVSLAVFITSLYRMCMRVSGGQRTAYRSQFSPSAV